MTYIVKVTKSKEQANNEHHTFVKIIFMPTLIYFVPEIKLL